MKNFKTHIFVVAAFLFIVAVTPELSAREHRHSHKRYRTEKKSSFSLNLNFDTPRYYVQEAPQPVYTYYNYEPQVYYPQPYYRQEVIIQRPVIEQRVRYYNHPQYSYWGY